MNEIRRYAINGKWVYYKIRGKSKRCPGMHVSGWRSCSRGMTKLVLRFDMFSRGLYAKTFYIAVVFLQHGEVIANHKIIALYESGSDE